MHRCRDCRKEFESKNFCLTYGLCDACIRAKPRGPSLDDCIYYHEKMERDGELNMPEEEVSEKGNIVERVPWHTFQLRRLRAKKNKTNNKYPKKEIPRYFKIIQGEQTFLVPLKKAKAQILAYNLPVDLD